MALVLVITMGLRRGKSSVCFGLGWADVDLDMRREAISHMNRLLRRRPEHG
ncbi:hypothetical protein L7D48_26215 [Streptomyces sp. S1A]|uniref:hypothetical protein n=1 Tax=Streptomyces sp. ICN903 TaxID=2964654 RepID=UPI001EDB75D1|nr:hypothetical protein [Streptomyces sp. ICN903]MCG3044031.1 hypothetical protein [Streptomyces sp. ICN903]